MRCLKFQLNRSELGGGDVESKELILSRIRAAAVPPSQHTREETKVRSVSLDTFCERVEDYRASIHRIESQNLESLLATLCSDQKCLIAPGFEFGIPNATTDFGFSSAELVEFDTSITVCKVGIEESGTIVLDGGPGQGRRAISLIPDHHICLIRADQIVSTLEEALEELDPTRPLTFISGPSATSDIELVRVEGVHGPRKLDVVVIV